MSIRKEHLDVFDKSLSSLQENVDLAKQLVLDKGSIEKKIETGFMLIGGLGQSYQGIQNVKALLKKGTDTVKTTVKALQGGKEEARTTDTGSEETPTSQPDENVARASTAENTEAPTLPEETPTISETSFMSPEAEATARAVTSTAEETPTISETSFMSPEAEATARAVTSTAEAGTTESPGLLDQLAPLRELMSRRTQPINASEVQQRMLDFDPDQNISQIGNLSTEGYTRVLSGVENTIDEAGNALQSGVEGVTNTISDVAGSVSRAGAGLAENLTSFGTRLATTAGESIAPELSDALSGLAAGSLDIPIAGEVVALLAGVGSAIASAFEPQAPKPTISQVGADFSNTDEHSGVALSAY
jgi:hypothetical protein